MSLVTSSSPTTSAPIDSASGRTRFSSTSPWYVSAISAPCVLSSCAIAQARLLSLATPTISARLPSAIPIRQAPFLFPFACDAAPRTSRIEVPRNPFGSSARERRPPVHEHSQPARAAQSPSGADFHQIVGHFHPDVAPALEHLAAQVGENHSLGRETAVIAFDDRVVEMEIEMVALEIGALAKEQVGARADSQQLIGPSAVARERERLAADGHPQSERDVGLGMGRTDGGDARRAHTCSASGLELDEPELAHQGMRI